MHGDDPERDAISIEGERQPLLSPRSGSELTDTDDTRIVSDGSTTGAEPSSEEDPPSKSVFAIISLLLIGVFMANADTTLVLATYGSISSDFEALDDASWLTTSYVLALCAVQAIVGKLSDVYGRKPILLVSYSLFGVGSVICGIGQAMWQVIIGRVVSGIGAAGMTVIVSILITDLVPILQVAVWRSYVNVMATLGRSIGGPLGGWLADTIGWRWSFLGQAPLILVAILLVWMRLPSRSSTDTAPQKGEPSKLRRIDFVGAFTLAGTIIAFVGALSLGGQNLRWSHPIVIGLLISAVILGVCFVIYEVKFAFEPVLPPTLIIQRDVATSYTIMALQTAAQFAMMYTVPLYFRATQDNSNTIAGAHLFPAVLGNTIGGLLAGFVIQRTGRYKLLIIFATISSTICYTLLLTRWHGHTSILESLYIVPGGFGTGIVASATFIALTSSVEHSDVAIATGGWYLASTFGMVVGVATTSSVQEGSLKELLENALADVDDKSKIIRQVMKNVSRIARLDGDVRVLVVGSYVKSMEYSHMVSLGFAVLALVISLSIRERPLR